MPALLILKTVLAQWIRLPLAWLCAFAFTATWWGLEVFMPLGLATQSIHRSTAHYELAFLAGALAQAMALGPCLKLRWIIHQQSPHQGLGTDVLVLAVVAMLMGSTVVLPAEVFQRWQFPDFRTGTAFAALCLGWLQLAAMASVLPLRSSMRDPSGAFRDKLIGVVWIAFAVIVIPASVTGLSPHGSALLHLLDPGRLLRASFTDANLGWGAWIAGSLPILGWCFLGLGLAQRAHHAPPPPSTAHHALRHPRRHPR